MTKRPIRKSGSRPLPNFEVQVRIDKVVAEGDGFGRLQDGRVIFVEGGLPGELVVAKVLKQSKDYARGVVTEVLEANDQRVEPPCEYVAQGCGGCDLQHASVTLQRQIKFDIVRESLIRLGKVVDPDVRLYESGELPVVAARTTLRVASAPRGVGFRQRRSHDVVPIERCLVAHPSLNELLPNIRLDGAEECVVRVGVASGERMAWAEPADSVSGLPSDVGLNSDAVVHESISGQTFQISAASFFQSSPQAAAALVEATRRALGDVASWGAGPVVDAYCGVGLFATTVFPADRHVIAIESNPSACADARVNVAGRDIEIVQAPVEEWQPVEAAVVVADPARDGLRAGGVQVLTATKASVIVLISCDPASLGRDARLLNEQRYRLEYCEVLDLFPHTHHVEVVSRFIRDESMELL
jgi:23S rRNA (uracil1939-C5)-methyltransferase